MKECLNKWDKKYFEAPLETQQPVQVLKEYAHLLPVTGRALDYACGLGVNAIFLARRGLDVCGWDLSSIAIDRLQEYADSQNLPVRTAVVDLEQQPVSDFNDRFDVVVVSYYLYRPVFPALIQMLNTGGLLFYQTFIRDAVNSSGPSDPSYRLRDNELLELCKTLRVLVYREEGSIGDVQKGLRNEAYFVGRYESNT
jgi:tellurite methyltransferase